MEGKKIFDLPLPKQDDEPATKKYVDDLQNQYIDKRGNLKLVEILTLTIKEFSR